MSSLPIDIPEICSKIRHLCEEEQYDYKTVKQDLYNHIQMVKIGLVADLTLSDLQAVLALHQSLFDLKGRKASYAETEIAKDILFRLPFMIRMNSDEDPGEEEEVIDLEKGLSQSSQKRSFQLGLALALHAVHICNRPAEKSKRYLKRLTEGIKLLNELQFIYPISGLKPIYWSQANAKDEDLQFFALEGLAHHYALYEEALTASEQALLKDIIDRTDSREVASNCCQVLINAGEMDEMVATVTMDDWKERHWGG